MGTLSGGAGNVLAAVSGLQVMNGLKKFSSWWLKETGDESRLTG
jgi:hypothetical protein